MGANGIVKCFRPVVKITRTGMRLLSKNSNLVLTVIGATGVIATAALAIKGTIKAVRLCEEKKVVGRREVVETVWKCYIPTVGVLLLTTTAIICNGKINAKRLAVLTSAYTGSVEALKKIEETMSSEIGPKKTQAAIDKAEGVMGESQAPASQKDIIATGKGRNLFFCATTGQWFYSDWNGIKLAEQKVQKIISDLMKSWGSGEFIPLREAQEALGLPVTDMGDYMGWYSDDFVDTKETVSFVVSSDWMDLPWGREIVGVVRITPWPINL